MGLRTQTQFDTLQGLFTQLTPLQIYGTGLFTGCIIGITMGVLLI